MLSAYSLLNNKFNQLNQLNLNGVKHSKQVQNILNQITAYLLNVSNVRHLDDCGYTYNDIIKVSSYPYITIKHSLHNVLDDVSTLKVNRSEVDYDNVTVLKLAKVVNLLIWAIAVHKHNYLIKSVINNARIISKNGSYNPSVLSLLSKYHIIQGDNLQSKLIQKISYNNNFKITRDYAIAISKITNPSALYFCNKNNPWNIKQVSGNDIKRILKSNLNAKSDLKKALKKRKQLDRKINQLKKF